MSRQPCRTGVLNGQRILRTGSCELEHKFLQKLLRYTLCILIYLLARWIRTRDLTVEGRMTRWQSVESVRYTAYVLVYGKIYSVCLGISVAIQEVGSH